MILWFYLNPLLVCRKGKQEAGQNMHLTFLFTLLFHPYKCSSPGNTQQGNHEVALMFYAITDSSCQRENLWRQFVLDRSKAQLNFILIKSILKNYGFLWYTDTLLILDNKIRIWWSISVWWKSKTIKIHCPSFIQINDKIR